MSGKFTNRPKQELNSTTYSEEAATQTASMRFQWSVGILCTLVSLGLTIIIVGQRQVLVLLERNDLPVELDKLNTQLSNLNIFKDSVEKLLNQGNKEMKDLDDSMAKLAPVIEGKKGQIDDCQAEKKIKNDELEDLEKESMQIEENLKSESGAWNLEISNLKEQLVGYREICDYVKKNTLAMKLCGNKTVTVS